jgi:hypothetical protein
MKTGLFDLPAYLALIDLGLHQPEETEESLLGRTVMRSSSQESRREVSSEHLIVLSTQSLAFGTLIFSGAQSSFRVVTICVVRWWSDRMGARQS